MNLKPLNEQVMVITGASSGIGLSTARLAARAGARLVLAARSEQALRRLTQELTDAGGHVVFAVADVSREEDVARVAELAQETFGGFDTWVNNAGVGMYGELMASDVADMRRVFDINFWGVVYGSRVAVRHLRERGGALINLGSVASEQAIPLQALYSASKHAVKAFTDGLRMELAHEGAPISVTLIKPGPIDTPWPLNARSVLEDEPQHVPPVYAPQAVARAIVHAATTPTREVYVGAGAKWMAASGQWAPGLTERLMAALVIPRTHSRRPPQPPGQDILNHPSERLAERGDYPGVVQPVSVYTEAVLHGKWLAAGLLGAGWAAALWNRRRRAATGRPS
ncbi:SDR family oxidoreductase [Deinococcus sp. YIM 77859]|uniref:SDR family oxidoreductase n=1 Tax=Deinococcus sp. YIM 77859 TaxID=1540221 RepID=UPI0005560767|nr:SDR family oxidoreductase [Deinococcus sp. YIM 77859]